MSDDLNDDFDDDFSDGGFDDFDNDTNSLGDVWRNNPLVKIGVILLGVAFLIGGIIIFGGKSDPLAVSRVGASKDVNEAPGTNEVSETIRQAIEEQNTNRVEEAQRTGNSALPMPVEPPKGMIAVQEPDEPEEDPLERWRRMQEKRIQQQKIEPQEAPAPLPEAEPVDTITPAINALGEAMAEQMQSILESQKTNTTQTKTIAQMPYLDAIAAKEQAELDARIAAAQAEAAAAATSTGSAALDEENIILPAGTIEYAQIITAVSTDAPGPVLAEVVSGPLKGARAIGTFDENFNYLTLNFRTFVVEGVNFRTSAVAIDPDTTLPGVVTNIDRRYFSRVLLPAAGEFIEGFASALADSGRTTVTVNNDGTTTQTTDTNDLDTDEAIAQGVEEAGEQIADALDERADQIKPLLEIAPGTAIGILFVEPVVATPQVIRETGVQEPSSGTRLPTNFNNLLIPR